MNVSFSHVIACVTSPETKFRMRVMVGVKMSCARRHTSPGLKRSLKPSESVKRVNASRIPWKVRPIAAVCRSTHSAIRCTTP